MITYHNIREYKAISTINNNFRFTANDGDVVNAERCTNYGFHLVDVIGVEVLGKGECGGKAD